MRLSILVATIPAALLTIACDGGTFEQEAPLAPAAHNVTPMVVTSEGFELGGKRIVRPSGRPWERRDEWRADARPTPSVPAPVEPPVDPAPVDICQEVPAAAFAAIETARQANNGCDSDAECTLSFGDTQCGGAPVRAVSFAGLAVFELAFDKIDADLCSALGPECPIAVWDLAGYPEAVCIAGQCELDVRSPEVADAACNDTTERRETIEGCLDCDIATQKAWYALDAVVAEYNTCEVDSDCTHVIDDTGCAGTCGNAINVANVAAYDEARQGVSADYCTGGTCPVMMASCLAQEPVCNAGRCELVGSW